MYKVKITNLPRWISEIHLKHFFNNCGKMLQANIAMDENTLRPLGFGYITFVDDESVAKALVKDGAILDGSIIRVALDVIDEEQEQEQELIDPVEV